MTDERPIPNRKLSRESVKHMMRTAGAQDIRIGNIPAAYMCIVLEEIMMDITKGAKKITKHKGRITLSTDDIKLYMKLKWNQ